MAQRGQQEQGPSRWLLGLAVGSVVLVAAVIGVCASIRAQPDRETPTPRATTRPTLTSTPVLSPKPTAQPTVVFVPTPAPSQTVPVPSSTATSAPQPSATPDPKPTALPNTGSGGDADPSGCAVDAGALALDGEELAALAALNDYRAAHGLGGLTLSPVLQQIAAWKAQHDAALGTDEHDDPGRTWEQRFLDCGYPDDTWRGENLAAGLPYGMAALRQWQDSPEHNANLLNPNYAAAGIKHAQSSNPNDRYGWYWTLDLGSER